MPVSPGAVEPGEGPDQALPAQASLDLQIIGDVKVVVVIDETVAEGRKENPNHEHNQPKVNGSKFPDPGTCRLRSLSPRRSRQLFAV